MYVVGSAVLAVLLVFLEKTKVLKLHKTSSAFIAMLLTAAVAGLYFTEGARLLGAMGVKIIGAGSELTGTAKAYGNTSKAAIVIKIILMIVCAFPSATGLIYMTKVLVSRAAVRDEFEDENAYEVRRAKAFANRGIAASLLMIVMTVLMVILAFPHLDELMGTMILLNPVILLIFSLLTFGIALIALVGYFLAINGVLFMIVSGLGAAAILLYFFSIVMGFFASGSASRSNSLPRGRWILYVLLSLLVGWNILVFISLKKEISKNAG
ncbi:MAG: hypothetical protein J6Z29_08475 [Ruminococcus sp.]|nr:hypothetical protein [Ruminococcus sp.]